MSRVFLRELSSTQFETASSIQSASSSSSMPAAMGVASSAGGVVSSLELPHYSKYLLLAAYIASYNPAKTDKRFFSKVSLYTLDMFSLVPRPIPIPSIHTH